MAAAVARRWDGSARGSETASPPAEARRRSAVRVGILGAVAARGHGFFARDGGLELELLLGSASLGIALAGAGRFSLDASLQLPRRLWQRASGAIGAARWT